MYSWVQLVGNTRILTIKSIPMLLWNGKDQPYTPAVPLLIHHRKKGKKQSYPNPFLRFHLTLLYHTLSECPYKTPNNSGEQYIILDPYNQKNSKSSPTPIKLNPPNILSKSQVHAKKNPKKKIQW